LARFGRLFYSAEEAMGSSVAYICSCLASMLGVVVEAPEAILLIGTEPLSTN